jgi:hypothetical protein
MTDGDDHKSGFIGVITLNHGKRSLCEQTLAGLVLFSAQPTLNQICDAEKANQLREIELYTPVVVFEAEFPFLGMGEHPEQKKSLSGSPKQLLCRPQLQ